ncbi:hypothetical protein ROA7450_01797 [Roseovarius albus]|uniref:Uncharacterized protein n=1 Tax=Roseovarius albus TaxID=1247867 RepID=A0A1X6Z1B5_9RHOB|nr:hypothetical protein [Roseovarius albus]SLN37526.1 hypothetical protein ROA7450_01797 [Roseovarius albus]
MKLISNVRIGMGGAALAVVLSGCSIDPQKYETTPVKVNSSKGVVTCQLYTKERVLWDRSIGRPNSMSVQEADNICRAEGERQKNA